MLRLTARFERVEKRSITVSLRELKEEIAHLRDELRRIEGSIVKERLRTVEKALAQNYLELYASQMEEGLDERLGRLVREDCGKRGRCVESFRTPLTGLLEVIRERGLKSIFADLDMKLRQVENALNEVLDTPCELCQRNLLETLRNEKQAFQKIAVLEPFHRDEKIECPVDISFLVDSVLEPLANSARLKIFIIIYNNGRKSFSELSEIVGMRGGHLIFHLKKLLHAGLITQEGRKGSYIITPRGVDVIRKILSLQLNNQK